MLACKRASHSDLEKLIGKLGFAQLQVFPRCGRCIPQPLYKKLFPKIYNPILGSAIIKALKWRRYALRNSSSRKVDLYRNDFDFVIYTDASCEPIDHGPGLDSDESDDAEHLGIIGAGVLDKELHQNGINGTFGASFSWVAPEEVNELFNDTSIIYALELLAVLLTLYELRFLLRNKTVLFFADNNSAMCALIRGASPRPLAVRYIAAFLPSMPDLI